MLSSAMSAMSPVARRVLLVVVALAIAAPSIAQAETCYYKAFDALGNPIGPAYCTQDVWFHQGQTKAGNLAATGQTPGPTFNTTKPTASVTTGAGGGYLTNGAAWQVQGTRSEATGGTFSGTFTGAVDNIGVTMYMLAPGKQQDTTYSFGFIVEVDGKEIGRTSNVDVPLESGGDAARKASFVITEVPGAMEQAGVVTGDGVQHAIKIYLTAYPIATTTGVFVYDTTEVPSGMTFNIPGTLEDRFPVPIF
jgi:hypothetical protein